MARIRTIKPEFFTSEDIVSLSPLARLLYIALWCEADREGRLVWKPRTFKIRYLPADNCDADALARELVASGLVRLYGDGLAVIPRFARHQHLNPRESKSVLPAPDVSEQATREPRDNDASSTRVSRVSTGANLDLTHREEGKGREEYPPVVPHPGDQSESDDRKRRRRLPDDFALSDDLRRKAVAYWQGKGRADLDPDDEFAKFRAHHTGKGTRQCDWPATWQTWYSNAVGFNRPRLVTGQAPEAVAWK